MSTTRRTAGTVGNGRRTTIARRRGAALAAVPALALLAAYGANAAAADAPAPDAPTNTPASQAAAPDAPALDQAATCAPADPPLELPDDADASPALRLPTPTGPHPVGTSRVVLTDEEQTDPLAPEGEEDSGRDLLVQLWYPADTADDGQCAPSRYAPQETATANEEMFLYTPGALEAVQSPALLGAPVAEGQHPVILYNHGLFGSPMDSTAVALQLASDGYVVAATGTTHESPALVLPDGEVVTTSARAEELIGSDEITPLIGLRARDTSFVLDQLVDGRELPDDLADALDTDTVGAFGHSAGGAAALQAAHDRDEIGAAVNLDGFARQPDAAEGLDTPWLFVASSVHADGVEPSWPDFFAPSVTGSVVEMAGVGHLAVIDVGSDGWIDELGVEEIMPPEAFEMNYGHPAPGMMGTMAEGVTAFFDEHLRDGEGVSESFEVALENGSEAIASITEHP